MPELTFIFLINSLVIYGVFASTGEGMILGFVQRWTTYNIYLPPIKSGEKEIAFWTKPLWNCPACMASVYGTAGFYFTDLSWWWLPVYVFALSGFCYLISKLIK